MWRYRGAVLPKMAMALGLVIACASCMTSPAAAAEPEFIEPSGPFPYPFTATSGKIIVEKATTGDTPTCTSGKASDEISLAKKATHERGEGPCREQASVF